MTTRGSTIIKIVTALVSLDFLFPFFLGNNHILSTRLNSHRLAMMKITFGIHAANTGDIFPILPKEPNAASTT